MHVLERYSPSSESLSINATVTKHSRNFRNLLFTVAIHNTYLFIVVQGSFKQIVWQLTFIFEEIETSLRWILERLSEENTDKQMREEDEELFAKTGMGSSEYPRGK